MTVEGAARSEIGRTRARNEDAYAVVAPEAGRDCGLFIVCDGMGGHAEGDQASALAVRLLRERLAPIVKTEGAAEPDLAPALREAVLSANRAIFERNAQAGREGSERAGTTLALLLVVQSHAWVVHVGDSRVYQTIREKTSLLTIDHNVGHREIRRGVNPQEAWNRADARHLTQALGPFPDEYVAPDIQCLPIQSDSLFLLCTDGLSDNEFVERHEQGLLRPLGNPDADLQRGCERLVAAANRINGHDNLTAVLVRVSMVASEPDLTAHEEDASSDDARPGRVAQLLGA